MVHLYMYKMFGTLHDIQLLVLLKGQFLNFAIIYGVFARLCVPLDKLLKVLARCESEMK